MAGYQQGGQWLAKRNDVQQTSWRIGGSELSPSPPARVWVAISTGLFLLALLIGLFIGDDYGMSVDEPDNDYVGRLAAAAYTSRRGHATYLLRGAEVAHHGPSYFMPWQAASRLLLRVVPGWHITDAHHLINYLVYLAGLALFFRFARRLMDRRSSLMATLFVGTQPLLLGHAFINQKDSPFWVLLLASVLSGLAAVDCALERLPNGEDSSRSERILERVARAWRSAKPGRRWVGSLLCLLSALALLDLLTLELGFHFAEDLLRQVHNGRTWPLLSRLYRLFAEDADRAGVDIYLAKLRFAYWLLRPFLMVLYLGLAGFGLRFGLPDFWRFLWGRYRGAVTRFLGAGAVLGIALSLRPIGLFAAALVGLYWLLRARMRHLGLAAAYALSAGWTTYMTWPFLWDSPYRRFAESLLFTGNIVKETRYWGRTITSQSLPWHYFPSYFATQLTEPTLPLLLIGVGSLIILWTKKPGLRPTLIMIIAWIALPLFGLIVLDMGVYGNLRHLLFVVIPLLTLAGLGLRWLMDRLPNDRLRMGLFLLVLLPGILANVQLHPYQHIYFNSFAGGVARAADLHILDRWCTSYREAMHFINEDADPKATVTSRREEDVAEPFAREGIEVAWWHPSLLESADYLLTCGSRIGELQEDPTWQRVNTVERADAVLAEVYKRSSTPNDGP